MCVKCSYVCEILLCVWNTPTCMCVKCSYVCEILLSVKYSYVCEILLCRWNTHMCVKYSYVGEILLCVWNTPMGVKYCYQCYGCGILLIMSPHVYHGETYCFTFFCLSVCPDVTLLSTQLLVHISTDLDETWHKARWWCLDVHEVRIFRFVDFCNEWGEDRSFWLPKTNI
jgi:hypothetical protein